MPRSKKLRQIGVGACWVTMIVWAASVCAGDALLEGFQNPPASARPRVWWHWMNGNVTKDGIQKDLEWMKRVGIGGLQNFDGAFDTPQVVEKRLMYMTPEWQSAFRYAVMLADRLGLEFAIASSPGWSETGGPWVGPDDGMKKLVWSTTRVIGGKSFKGKLAAPSAVAGPFQDIPMVDVMSKQEVRGPRFYKDVAVIAYRTPRALLQDPMPVKITTSDASIDASALLDGDLSRLVTIPITDAKPIWVLYDFGKPEEFRSVTVSRPSTATTAWKVEASEDNRTFRQIVELPRNDSIYHITLAFPAVTAQFLRVAITSAPRKGWFEISPNAPGAEVPARYIPKVDSASLSELQFYAGARVNRFEDKAGFSVASNYSDIASGTNTPDEAVVPKDVVTVTDKMSVDGTLDWTPPAGNWTVLRFGYSLTGKTNHPASAEATGLEVDKLDRRAVKAYLDTYIGQFEKALGPDLMGKRGLQAFLTDSIESSGQNWTGTMLADFKARRGYDAASWLPALTGVIVGNAARTDRFLWDFRKTLMELISESHYGQVAESAHERGLTYYNESLEGYPAAALGDDLDMRQHGDIPMAAFWASYDAKKRDGIPSHIVDIRGAASVSHVFGQNLVAAESLTSCVEPFAYSPADLRPIIDMEFALGVNRPVIHTSVHQPTEQAPGMTLGPYGQYFTRHETWADMAGAWVTYLSRTAYLLQQGRFVGDVAWFYGEDGPAASLYDNGEPSGLPEGYGFDFVNANMLLNHLNARDGRLVSSAGASYRILYLGGSSERMTLGVLKKLKTLADAGIAIAGRMPTASPSLADEGHEAEYQQLIAELWGKGKVVVSGDPNVVLRQLGVARDFECEQLGPDGRVMFQHREVAGGDIYYLTNRKPRSEHIKAHFRVTGRRPELWHADSGRREAVTWSVEKGLTVVPLDLYAYESVFVVFHEPTKEQGEQVPPVHEEHITTLSGDWQLSFESGRGAPVKAVSTRLGSWTASNEAGIKYFSGVGTYRKTFTVRAADFRGNALVVLDLGEVGDVAEVMLNGKAVGTAWHAPFTLDVTDAIKAGSNDLEIRVANLWVNRLIGDRQAGATPIASTVSLTYRSDTPLRASGLIGPVRLFRKNH